MANPLPVSCRLEPRIKEAAKQAAADDHRSLASLIEKVLADYLRKRGYLKGKRLRARR
jgi:hypothetical protein